MDGPDEIGVGHRPPLVVGNADQLHFREGRETGPEVGQVEPPVKGGEAAPGEMAEQREVDEIDMEMKDVVAVRLGQHAIDHRQRVGQMIVDPGEPQALVRAGHQPRRRLAVAAGVERDVVAELDQRFGQPPDDPFGAAIKLGRHGLREGRDLSNTQQDLRSSPGRHDRRRRQHLSTATVPSATRSREPLPPAKRCLSECL